MNHYTIVLLGSFIVPEEGVRENKLIAIPGTPPNLKRPPKGCRFADRCKYATPTCMAMEVPNLEVSSKEGSANREYRCLMSVRKIREVYENE